MIEALSLRRGIQNILTKQIRKKDLENLPKMPKILPAEFQVIVKTFPKEGHKVGKGYHSNVTAIRCIVNYI